MTQKTLMPLDSTDALLCQLISVTHDDKIMFSSILNAAFTFTKYNKSMGSPRARRNVLATYFTAS